MEKGKRVHGVGGTSPEQRQLGQGWVCKGEGENHNKKDILSCWAPEVSEIWVIK